MNPARKLATTSSLALMLALAGCTGDDPDAQADPTPVANEESPSPSAAPDADGPTDLRGLVGRLEPGSYLLAAWGETNAAPLPRAVVEVPEGYWSNGGYVIDAGQDAFEPAEFGVVQMYAVDQVLADPCRRPTATDVGPTVTDLARALDRQAGPSTRPSPVVLDGHRGLYLEVTVPPSTDLAACTNGEYPLWLAKGDTHAHSDPGVVHHLWILDVDGTRLVVVASLYPDQDPAQNQELLAMAESIHFVEPDS